RSFINILGSSRGANTKRRIKAYFDFCEEHEIPPHDIQPFLDITNWERTLKAINLLDEMTVKPDAIITHSDQVASFIISQFRKRDIKMPEEISVVGFDNLMISDLMNFISVDYSIKEQVRIVRRLLLNVLEAVIYKLMHLRYNLVKWCST